MAFDSGKPLSSGVFRYRYQNSALNIVMVELMAIAFLCGAAMESLGFGLLSFVGLAVMLFMPYIRVVLVLAISGVYVMLTIALLLMLDENKDVFGGLDYAGAGFIAFLISLGIHAFVLDWAKDAST